MTTLVNVDGLLAAQREFAAARHWQPFHTPRNLMLALTGEVGELAEIFQWKTDGLADVTGVDLNAAVADKLQKNTRKYPPDSSRTLG